jgi:hypothetical protein
MGIISPDPSPGLETIRRISPPTFLARIMSLMEIVYVYTGLQFFFLCEYKNPDESLNRSKDGK